MKIVILGSGYLGRRASAVWGDEAVLVPDRIESSEQVHALLQEHRPDALFNAAGVTGKPNVDWCETHQIETIQGNTVLPILIAQAAQRAGVYMLQLATGCIFYGDSPHPDRAWREDDFGNPVAVYSRAKFAADLVLSTLPNVGIARLRMPIDDHPNPANLIDKITTYPRVVDVENSVTVVPDLLDACLALMEKRGQGIFHCTNPGTITHREIIGLYRELVDSTHTNEWITEQALVTEGLARKKRSNNFMVSSRLEELGISMPEVRASVREMMVRYAAARTKGA